LHRTHSVFPVTFPAYLEEADGFTHGGLDMKILDILPVLLEERDEEVDAEHDVSQDLIVIHFNVADGDTQAEDLLELEFDGRADLDDLVAQVLSVRDGSGELASFG